MAFSLRNFFGGDDYTEETNYQAQGNVALEQQPTYNAQPNNAQQQSFQQSAAPVQPQQAQPRMQTVQQAPRPQQQQTASVNVPGGPINQIALFEPKVYSDAKTIANQLVLNEAVIINFSSIDDVQAKRIVDFLAGSVYALSGEIERIGDEIFLVTPSNYQISGSLSANLEPNNRY